MPELPEVETISIGLRRLIIGKKISRTRNYDSPKSFPNTKADIDAFLVGATVTRVRRRAKVLFIDLSSKYTLMTHLKMTGQLIFRGQKNFGGGHPTDSLIGELPDRSTRVQIDFDDGSHLFFNDQRKFGWMKLVPTAEVANTDFMKRVGPEPLEDSFTGEILFERLQRRKKTSIKGAILDQSVLAGVGNIYADEALWMARIHPRTLVKDVPRASVTDLANAIKEIMELSLSKGGSTDRNYTDAEGKRGNYLKFANVFRREGQPCNRCGAIIEKIRVAGRGTHICSVCQVQDV